MFFFNTGTIKQAILHLTAEQKIFDFAMFVPYWMKVIRSGKQYRRELIKKKFIVHTIQMLYI